jgi:hypothetical protein
MSAKAGQSFLVLARYVVIDAELAVLGVEVRGEARE